MIRSVADNDILYKGARYGLLRPMLEAMRWSEGLGILGAAKFIVRRKVAKRPPGRGAEVALSEFEEAIKHLTVLEPSIEEVRVASGLEQAAQSLGVELDAGESQLCAIVIHRSLRLLLTGDKRAIAAIHKLVVSGHADAVHLRDRIACLEQVFLSLLAKENEEAIRHLVCAEPDVDRTLCICFACSAACARKAEIAEGLLSYVSALQGAAPGILVARI